jgi:hypothetical protein
MRLFELFEANVSSVGLIFGRFNPPHKGHKAAWQMASENPVWFVGTNKSTQGPKDPLPYEVKIKAMETIWPEVSKHIAPSQSWLTLASEIYQKYGDVELRVYTDEDWVLKTLEQYNGKEGAHGGYNFPKITKVPTPRLSSATALRTAVALGDRRAFADAAGVSADTMIDGKPFFDLVAEYLGQYKKESKAVVSAINEYDDEEEEIYYSKKFASVAKKIFKSMYPDAKVNAREDDDGYLAIETTDGVFGFSMGVTHQYGDNVITVANAYAGQYKGVVGQLVKSAVEFLQQKHPDAETTLVAQHDVSDNYWPQLANKLGINYENNAW